MSGNGKNKIIGAVLVEGGGIAGVQASLDLANSGYKVYLVNREATIGGMMSHLDKTFPTGDCAICVISPKLVECARNINIEILTLSELVKLEGEPGNFKATIKKSPRYINEQICNDCGECTTACPVETDDIFNRYLGRRKAVQKYYAQAIPNKPNLLKLGHAPCKMECPANINVQGYIQLIKKKEYVKAVKLIRERNPLSAICGRVCPAPCESACKRSDADSAVAIRQLKRFASDREMEMVKSGKIDLPAEQKPSSDARKVAVIGAGPAGLTVAHDLACEDIAVTVYESQPKAGGMLRYGIPDYRLPKEILDYEIELIRRKGVEFIFNCKAGADISIDELLKKYEAIFIGTGAQLGAKLGLKGEDTPGVIDGLEFLRKASNTDDRLLLSGHAVVIGGGDVAMDAACNATRLGADKVTVLYRRTAVEMPAIKEEVVHAREEGVNFIYLAAPVEFIKNKKGKLKSVRCIRMKLAEPDESGRRRPVAVKGSEFNFKADTAIIATGSLPEENLSVTTPNLEVNKNLYINTDKFGRTSIKGVFSGGDVVTGAATVIEAVGAGKKAAESILKFLNGEDITSNRFEDSLRPVPEQLLPSLKHVNKLSRVKTKELDPSERIGSFDEIEFGLTEEEALAEAERCLNCAQCCECMECVEACDKKAINHTMKDELIELEVGSVILTPGIEEFTAEVKGEYGFNRYKNVLTNVQFERMLSAAGPSTGHIVRRDNGEKALRIAWIQCVGSRDTKTNEYCSSICCMASIKQAIIASEHQPGLEATIFNIDIRAHGKDFDQYYERARGMKNIRFVKSIPSSIVQMPPTKNLRLGYFEGNKGYHEQEFDLVVLAAGLDPKISVTDSIKRLGIEINEYGFGLIDRLNPLITSKPGVFAGGAFQEPKDIPETVMQASAAASMAMEMLSPAKNTMIRSREYPQEHDVTDEKPRIGVFVCHCGINIAGIVDVEKVTESIKNEPGVVYASHTMFTCSDASLSDIKTQILSNRLNRIVVASCTPRTHEPIFRETLREAGLNPYLFELSNIRDQCSWVHSSDPDGATLKAIELVKMSISRAYNLIPLEGDRIPIRQNALIIGGGVSGMSAALSLAEQGYDVDLIEKSSQLGGNLKCINSTLESNSLSTFKNQLIEDVNKHRNIDIYLDSDIESVSGHIGDFKVTFSIKGKTKELICGAIIIATGAKPAETEEYSYGIVKNIMTQLELEKSLQKKKPEKKGQTYVMIQCVGSRTPDRPYCSRICCSMAVKNALKIKKYDPDARIFILYRDIRTYGFREKYYREARKAGVIFIRYDEENIPVVSEIDGVLNAVKVESPDFPEPVVIEADKLILSTGLDANEDNRRLADMLKVPLNTNGFYVEAHMKLRPVDFATEGLFVCGLAHSPKMIDENISQAKAAAARAATILSKTHLEVGAQVSRVDQNKCISCMTCIKACPYGAPMLNYDHKAEIQSAKCMGCGICAAECPARAIQLNHFRSEHFKNMIDKLFNVVETV